jgi:hypothetical protein
MIQVLTDLYQSSRRPANAYLVAGVSDYVAVRRAVREALDNQGDLTLYITDVVVAQWLSDLQRYPTTVVKWVELRPETVFQQFFGVLPPPPFTADLLSALALETLTPPPPGSNLEPVSVILGQRIDPIFGYTEPPVGQFERVVLWAASQTTWVLGRLVELLSYQLSRWTTSEPRFSVLRPDTLPADARQVLIRSALVKYDAAWCRRQSWCIMPQIEFDGAEQVVIDSLRPLHSQIAAYWNERYAHDAQTPEMIDLALIQMSGLSQAEFDALGWMIEQHPSRLTMDLLTKIERRFSRLPGIRSRLTMLRRLVAPSVPTLPDDGWNDAHWLRWAVNEYIPYFGWVLRTSQPRNHQIACAERFADWVYDRYPHWLNDDDAPLARQQHSQLRALLERDPNVTVFWLVLDGMAWWHSEMLRPLCEQNGLYVQEHTPAVAALPSITHIAKRALITGMSTTDIEQSTIFAAASAHFARIRIPTRITYQMHEALDSLRAGTSRCVIMLDNAIDETAHQRRDFTDSLAFQGHLNEVATALGQACEICARQGRRLHILIGSDHGGTLLPNDLSPLPLPRSVKPVEEIWEDETQRADAQKHSPRAAVIEDINHIPTDELARWYVLDRDQFQLERHYLAPRGYSYLKPRPSGWTHGGLTPEELLVPMLHLAPELPQIEPLRLVIDGSLRPRQSSMLTIMLTNVNRFPLEQVMLTIDGVDYVHLLQLDATASQQLDITLPGVTTQAAESTLVWRIDYMAFGVAHMQEGQSEVSVRRLSTDTSDFDDIFGDL